MILKILFLSKIKLNQIISDFLKTKKIQDL